MNLNDLTKNILLWVIIVMVMLLVFSRYMPSGPQRQPLTYSEFERFLPGSPAFDELAGIVRFFTNDEWFWQLRPTLAASQAPGMVLGRAGRLGWTGWLGGRALGVNDVVIRGDRAA